MLRAHRQAWAWQDEWFGMNMEDIRALERETQALLAKKMAVASKEAAEQQQHQQPVNNSRSGSVSKGTITAVA